MTDHERGVEAAVKAIDDFPYDTLPEGWIHRAIAERAISAYLAIAEPGKPESGVLAEAVAGYLFEMRYESDRWSGTMFAEQINLPASDVRNIRPLYASPAADEITALRKRCAELEAALKQCQSVLAMFIHPDAIMETTVLNAYALATAAEAKARSLLPTTVPTAPKPFTFADPSAQLQHERHRAESKGRERE